MARISTAAAMAALDAITALANVGGQGSLNVYNGTLPTNCETAIGAQTLLATHLLAVDAFPDASDGTDKAVSASNVIGDDIAADASGAPQFIRVLDFAEVCIFQGTAGAVGTEECVFDKSPFVAGDLVKILGLTLQVAE
jgi:hypothetical protein